MSYLETLNSHNTQIQNLINKANALPEAGGGGGGVESCTVSFNPSAFMLPSDVIIFYTDNNMQYQSFIFDLNITTKTIAKGSIILIDGADSGTSFSTTCSQIMYRSGISAYLVSGDGYIEISA